MAETTEEKRKWLTDEPLFGGDPALNATKLQEHIAFSLWRIATALERANDVERNRITNEVQRSLAKRR